MVKEQITVEIHIHADVAKVWNYWNAPDKIIQWNFASNEWHCPKAEVDLRIGGKLITRMEAKNGSFGFDLEGVYEEIVNQKTIGYVMPDGRKVVTQFAASDGNSTVTTTFDSENQSPVAFQKQGWQAILNNFKKYVEAN